MGLHCAARGSNQAYLQQGRVLGRPSEEQTLQATSQQGSGGGRQCGVLHPVGLQPHPPAAQKGLATATK